MTKQNTRIAQSGRCDNLVVLLTLLFVLNLGVIQAQKNPEQAVWIENSVQVNGTIDEAWQVLADFAGAGAFHVLYEETILLKGNPKRVVLGAERESLIPDGMFNLIQKERVVDVVDGAYFTYEVYDSDKSTLESMLVTYGVTMDEGGNVRIYNHIALEEGPRVWKNFSKRKQNRDSQLSLISYKHRIETGKSEKDIKSLKKWYALNEDKRPVRELLATTDLEVN
jgi:hypothetical protein